MNDQTLLMLTTLPAIEGPLVDWLLARADVPGFTTVAVHGHGTAHHKLSLAEQVEGRQRRIMFEIQLPAATVNRLIEDLQRDFAGSPVHYWVVPVLAAGHLAGEIAE
jgi:hypothetical protein